MLLENFGADPFAYLGMHVEDGAVVVRACMPNASHLFLRERGAVELREMKRIDSDGIFELRLPDRHDPFDYVLVSESERGREEIEDAFRFGPILGDVDAYLIAEGTHLRLWEVLGAHLRSVDGIAGVAFAVWAPNAQRVSVVGDFNDWDGRRHPMRNRIECGVWEIFIPGVRPGALYKYEIVGAAGELLPLKADPLARYAELRPATASIVWDDDAQQWHDEAWMQTRGARNQRSAPIAI
jgi:1,4-alpha-glucan branching enzyme